MPATPHATPALRVLVVAMPQLTRAIVEQQLAESDAVVLVSSPSADTDLAVAARETDADCIVFGLVDGEPDHDTESYLGRRRRPALVGVDIADAEASIFRVTTTRVPVDRPVNGLELVAEIVQAARDVMR